MKNTYLQQEEKHEQEINNFSMFFAFSKERLGEGLEKLGLKKEDVNHITSIGSGGFIRKTDVDKYIAMMQGFEDEKKKRIDEDIDGTGYIFEMFFYELNNHEYNFTGELTPTLDALGFTMQEVNNQVNLKNGLKLAMKEARKQ